MPPILKPNPRKALQRCWCPVETYHGRTRGPKDRECLLLLDPLWYLYGRLWVAVWTAHIVLGANRRGSCAWYPFTTILPSAFLHSVGCPCVRIVLSSLVCISLLSKVILVSRSTVLACWVRSSFVHHCTTFAPIIHGQDALSWHRRDFRSNITAGLAQMFPLSSLITMAGMAQGTAT